MKIVRYLLISGLIVSNLLVSAEAVFGRHLVPYSQLYPHVHAVFRYFRRCYYNRIRRDYKAQISLLAFPEAVALVNTWKLLGYSDTALNLLYQHISALIPT